MTNSFESLPVASPAAPTSLREQHEEFYHEEEASSGARSFDEDAPNVWKKELVEPQSSRRLAQRYKDFPQVKPSTKENKKSKKELKREKERVDQEREQISIHRHQALEELKARKRQVTERLDVCEKKVASADLKLEQNEKVRKERDLHYELEMESNELRIQTTQNECEELKSLLEQRAKYKEQSAKAHGERLMKLEEWNTMTTQAMHEAYKKQLAGKIEHLDMRKQMQEAEADITFLEGVLSAQRQRTEIANQLQTALQAALRG